MPKRWTEDDALVSSIASNLLGTMSMFPKRMVRVDELIHKFSMPLSHIQVMMLISQGDLSIGQISERMGIAKPNITPLLDSLDARGYVVRARGGSDRRIVYVHLQDAGAECLDEIRKTIANQIRAWPNSLTKSEAKQLEASLANLNQAMDALNEQD